jgi:glutaredoxin
MIKSRSFFLFVIILCSLTHADVVYLKDGGKIEGIVKSSDTGGVTIRVSIGEMKVDKKDIDSVAVADAKGKATLSARWNATAKADAKKRVQELASRKTPSRPNTPDQVQKVKLKPVKIFVTEWCGVCRKLEAALQANRIPFVVCDIEKSSACRQEYTARAGGHSGVPLSIIGDAVILGYDPDRISGALQDPSAWEIE